MSSEIEEAVAEIRKEKEGMSPDERQENHDTALKLCRGLLKESQYLIDMLYVIAKATDIFPDNASELDSLLINIETMSKENLKGESDK